MIELTWNLFVETGNVEAYLLFKELESKSVANNNTNNNTTPTRNESESVSLEAKM